MADVLFGGYEVGIILRRRAGCLLFDLAAFRGEDARGGGVPQTWLQVRLRRHAIYGKHVINALRAAADNDGGRARSMVHIRVMADDVVAVDCCGAVAVLADVEQAAGKEQHVGACVAFIKYNGPGGSNLTCCILNYGPRSRGRYTRKRFHQCIMKQLKFLLQNTMSQSGRRRVVAQVRCGNHGA